jgi:hypothetical protein
MIDLEALMDRLTSTTPVRVSERDGKRKLFGNRHRLYCYGGSDGSFCLFCTTVDSFNGTSCHYRYNLVFSGERLVIEVRFDRPTDKRTFTMIRGDDHVLTLAALL